MKPLRRHQMVRRSAGTTRAGRRPDGPEGSGYTLRPGKFIFLDKTNGTHCFEIGASANGSLPSEQAAIVLAMHCLGRSRAPEDFNVMVPADDALLATLATRVKDLISSCTFTFPTIHLSPRQQDVLREVLQQRANKEIAADLHVSVRTAKFHVSSLLQKFRVQNRMGLIQQASDGIRLGADLSQVRVCASSIPDSNLQSPTLQAVPALAMAAAASAGAVPVKISDEAHPRPLRHAAISHRQAS